MFTKILIANRGGRAEGAVAIATNCLTSVASGDRAAGAHRV